MAVACDLYEVAEITLSHPSMMPVQEHQSYMCEICVHLRLIKPFVLELILQI